MNRAIGAAGSRAGNGSEALRAVSLTAEQPRALYGREQAVAVTDLSHLQLGTTRSDAQLRAIEAAYASSSSASLREAGAQSFELARALSATRPREAAGYPDTLFGNNLRDIATLIKADAGLQVAFAESRSGTAGKGSWDTHSQALDPRAQFSFPPIAEDFSKSLAAFWNDLGSRRDDVVVVTHTDFGRNVVQNDGRGCDHGRATTMLVLGSRIRGGEIHGRLPERFERDALEDAMDLPVTTDYRAVLAELAGAQLGIPRERDSQVFPGWNGVRSALVRA
jgi:uncharacterized protein (DUF1501 family)